MNLHDDYPMIVVSRKQLLMLLQAVDTMIDDATWMPLANTIDDLFNGGEMVNIRTINNGDVCDDHVHELQRSQQRLFEWEQLFDVLLQSDDEIATWARSTIAVMTHNIDDDDTVLVDDNE
jgi:hypothetical protein